MKKQFSIFQLIFFVVLLLTIIILYVSRVDNRITQEDVEFITNHFINLDAGDPYSKSYEKQLDLIKSIQHSVFIVAPTHNRIDKRNAREPKDLYLNKGGICNDRSRVIEKILRYYGFKTRHIALYSTGETDSNLKSILTPGIPSHALTEVLTSKGWLVVDSNEEWVAIDKNNHPISISEIIRNKNSVIGRLKNEFPFPIYVNDFFAIYGLYSRHGMYYPPYNFIPDINYSEFLDNFI